MAKLTDFTFAFEMAMAGTPKTASPTYSNLTQYVMAGQDVNLSRGRSSEYDAQAQPGVGNVTLRNGAAEGYRFTYGNTGSPYYPLAIRRPCRWRVTYSGTTYDRWYGFNDSWGNGRESTVGTVDLRLSDRIARAAKAKMKAQVTAEALLDGAIFHYPMDEDSTSTVAGDRSGISGVPSLARTSVDGLGVITFGSTPGHGPDATSTVLFTNPTQQSGAYLNSRGPGGGPMSGFSASSSAGFTLMGVIQPTTAAQGLFLSATATGTPQADHTHIGVDLTGQLYAEVTRTAGAGVLISTGAWVANTPLHVAVVHSVPVASVVTVTFFINGASAGSGTYSSATCSSSLYDQVTVGGYGTVDAGRILGSGKVSYVSGFATALSSARVLDHANGLAGWLGETSDLRFNRYCRHAGLPTAWYATSGTGRATMGLLPALDRSLLDVLRDVAEAENGVVYVTKAGVLRFATRAARYGTTVGLTLDATKPGHVPSNFGLTTDDLDLLNDLTISTPAGAGQRVYVQASIDAYDLHDDTRTIYVDSDVQALNTAQWFVGIGATPVPRTPELVVDVVSFANSGGNVANLLNADVGTRVRVSLLPSDTSATTTVDMFVEGVRDVITKDRWIIVFPVSPVGSYGGLWTIEDPVYGSIDGPGVLAL